MALSSSSVGCFGTAGTAAARAFLGAGFSGGLASGLAVCFSAGFARTALALGCVAACFRFMALSLRAAGAVVFFLVSRASFAELERCLAERLGSAGAGCADLVTEDFLAG